MFGPFFVSSLDYGSRRVVTTGSIERPIAGDVRR